MCEGRILLVDPTKTDREATKELLKGWGYDVTAVVDGQKALDKLASSEAFDLIISEQGMPNLDGLQLMDEKLRREDKTPIIFLTAFGDVQTYFDLMNFGAFGYFNKPMDPEELKEVIPRAIASIIPSKPLSKGS